MNVHQIKIFYITAHTLSITEAAKQMHLTQPSISIQLKDLEEDLNVRLFDRINRRLYLTDAGKVFFKYAHNILNLMDEARAAMDKFRAGNIGRLVIGASNTVGLYILPQILRIFRDVFPKVEISLNILNRKEALEKCRANDLDFAFVQAPVDLSACSTQAEQEDFEATFFTSDELVVICSPKHHLAKGRKFTTKLLREAGEPIILREEGSESRDLILSLAKELGLNLNVTMEVNTTEGIKKAVEEGLGIGIVSKNAINRELKDSTLVAIDIHDLVIKRDFYMVYNKKRKLSPLMKRFYDFISDKHPCPIGHNQG
ncbi:MAG: LysR family transcriptional regulator [Deltaproteobacteria bacterium]|nr:LysR family transcriptional regulator [Deltaproteobacteria bacterium]